MTQENTSTRQDSPELPRFSKINSSSRQAPEFVADFVIIGAGVIHTFFYAR